MTIAEWPGSSWRQPASTRAKASDPEGVALRASTPASPFSCNLLLNLAREFVRRRAQRKRARGGEIEASFLCDFELGWSSKEFVVDRNARAKTTETFPKPAIYCHLLPFVAAQPLRPLQPVQACHWSVVIGLQAAICCWEWQAIAPNEANFKLYRICGDVRAFESSANEAISKEEYPLAQELCRVLFGTAIRL